MTSTSIESSSAAQPALLASRSALARLYLIRGLLAVAWAVTFARVNDALSAWGIVLLIGYPLIDAVSSFIEYRADRFASTDRRIAWFNATLSIVAATALGVASRGGVAPVLGTFGVWAVAAGAAQFVRGLRRRGAELGKQWPMLAAGGLSVLAGASYGIQAVSDKPLLSVLSIYAAGGGVFFLVQAGLLAWRSRQQRHATPVAVNEGLASVNRRRSGPSSIQRDLSRLG